MFFNLPLATRLILQGWATVPAEEFRLAAALSLGPRQSFRILEMPMLARALPGAFLVVFLICLTSFAVVLTLGGGPRATTIELAIYQAFRLDFDLSRAALLALIQVAIGLGAALLTLRLGRMPDPGRGLDRPLRRWDSAGLPAPARRRRHRGCRRVPACAPRRDPCPRPARPRHPAGRDLPGRRSARWPSRSPPPR